MNIDPAQLWQLLEVQHLDDNIAQVTPEAQPAPYQARIAQARATAAELTGQVRAALLEHDKVAAELKKVTQDADVVGQRLARDQQLLQTSASTKDIQGLTSEVETLTQRQDALEEAQLELMQRVEDDQARLDALKAQHAEAVEAVRLVHEEAQRQLADKRATLAKLQDERQQQAGQVDEKLLAFYDRVRARSGNGVAKLERGVCGACHLQLGPIDRDQVAKAPATELVQCPECGVILLRVQDGA